MHSLFRKTLTVSFLIVAFCLAARYLFPLFFPFVLGAGLSLAAEPAVRFLCTRLHLRRGAAAALGVSMTFLLLGLCVLLLCGLIIRELGCLAGVLPEIETAVRSGMLSLSGWLLSLARRAPDGIRSLLTQSVNSFFSGSSKLLDSAAAFILRLASGILSQVPDRALTLATAIISSFMFSAKLPLIRRFLRDRLSLGKLQPLLDSWRQVKTSVLGWVKAQLKLSAITGLVVTAGFLLLRVRNAPVWALLVAGVDALPILGSGAVLVPWSLVCFLQGESGRAFGLLGVYAAAAILRSVLEPRLVGKHLGLDPLITLIALYSGYKLFGILGMILAPILAVVVTQLVSVIPPEAQG